MSQAQLAELVGRSPSAVRSWERDLAVPTDEAVLNALSAVLGIDRGSIYAEAGGDVPELESSPTVEQALASLSGSAQVEKPKPDSTVGVIEQPVEAAEPVIELDLVGSGTEAEGRHGEPAVSAEPLLSVSESKRAAMHSRTPSTNPAFVEPADPFVVTAAIPPVVEPSYMEDSGQRQLYRVRNLATIVLLVALVVTLLWALGSTVDAFGSWWESFWGTLRL